MKCHFLSVFILRLWLIPLFLSVCYHLYGDAYHLSVDELDWRQEQKKYFFCRMVQAIPLFGSVAIEASAGRQLSIEISSSLFPVLPETAQLELLPIPWGEFTNPVSVNPGYSKVPIEKIEFLNDLASDGIRFIIPLPARELLQKMSSHSRLSLTIVSNNQHTDNRDITVTIPTVGMLPSLTESADCIDTLLPKSFQQLQQYNLYYTSGQKEPDSEQRQWLADTVRYLEVDDTINAITIDGHSDGAPFKQTNETLSRLKNLKLSEERAFNISRQLKAYIEEAKIPHPIDIKVRHHGERYPLAGNRTTKDRQLNRRVEISLERKPLTEHETPDINEVNQRDKP